MGVVTTLGGGVHWRDQSAPVEGGRSALLGELHARTGAALLGELHARTGAALALTLLRCDTLLITGIIAVIRAYGLVEEFAATNEARVGRNLCAWYTLKSCDRWLSVRLENIGNLIVLAGACTSVDGTDSCTV